MNFLTISKRYFLSLLFISVLTSMFFPINVYSFNVMAHVPQGDFIMGANDKEIDEVIKKFGHRGDFDGYDFNAEKPKSYHYLDSFYIDSHEVTN